MTEDTTPEKTPRDACPICGHVSGQFYAGERQCEMSFGGSMQAWEDCRAELVRRGCILLDDGAEHRAYQRGVEDAAGVVAAHGPLGAYDVDTSDIANAIRSLKPQT